MKEGCFVDVRIEIDGAASIRVEPGLQDSLVVGDLELVFFGCSFERLWEAMHEHFTGEKPGYPIDA